LWCRPGPSVHLGLRYWFNPGVLAFRRESSGLEIPTAGWPSAGEGTTLTSTSGPWKGNYKAVYLMIGYAYGYGYTGVVQLGAHPQTGEDSFTNCEEPSVDFPIASFGGLGINTDGIYAEPDCDMSVEDEDNHSPPPTGGPSWGAIKALYR
ncbi:hypothetical protein ACFL6M_06535, partial [Candidatus Eisenbacteria bacterium]